MQLMTQKNSCEHICRKILSLDIASYITSIGLCVLLLAWPLQVNYTCIINVIFHF